MIDKSAFIHPTAIVETGAIIGANVHIGPFCIVGPHVEIGEGTVLKSHVVVNGHTTIGCNNEIDCTVGSRCILANNATLAGHVSVDDFAIIGGMTAVHQFCIIGAHVMVGGCSGVAQDVPPFVIAQGNHATPFGVNIEGLKRRGFSREAITAIRNAYKLLYRSGKTLEEPKAVKPGTKWKSWP